MGGRREVSIISHRPVTRSDLKQEMSFLRGSVSTVLQLVVALLRFTFISPSLLNLLKPSAFSTQGHIARCSPFRTSGDI